jgi:bla regulator protein blaR1
MTRAKRWAWFGLAAAAAAQTPTPPSYGYEVVTIHKAAPGQTNSGFSPGAHGGLRARNDSVMQLLTFAYDAHEYQFVDAPEWTQTERFEIELTPDKPDIAVDRNMSATELDGWLQRNRQRLQAVLRDRFGLALRAETREQNLYALTVAKDGPKLMAADPQHGVSFNINNGRQITARSASIEMLAGSLAQLLGRYVRDETGLGGRYDFKMEFEPVNPPPSAGAGAADEPARPSIFTALTEQLGLRLESKKGPVPVFVIEKIERPSEN